MNIVKRRISTWIVEIFVLLISCVGVYLISGKYDILEKVFELSRKYEHWELDEIIVVSIFLALALTCFSVRRVKDLLKSKSDLHQRNTQLLNALSEIKELRGIIPICSSCKKVRDDHGFWQQVEVYIQKHTDAQFTHGLCSDCIKELYPELVDVLDNKC